MNYLKIELYERVKHDPQIFDFIQKNLLDGLWYWDLEKPENEWLSPKFWQLLGYNPDEMPHSPAAWQNIIDAQDLEIAQEKLTTHLKNPQFPYEQIVRYKHQKGNDIWVKCYGTAIFDANGNPYRMLGAHVDVTEMKLREIKAKEEAAFLKSIYENQSVFIFKINEKRNFTFANSYLCSFFNVKEDDLHGSYISSFFEKDEIFLLEETIDKCIKSPNTKIKIELSKEKNQTSTTTLWEFICTETSTHIEILALGFDVSAQKQLAQQLENQVIKTNQVLEGANIGSWEWNVQTGEMVFSEGFAQMLGYSLAELAPNNIQTWEKLEHPDDFNVSNKKLKDCFDKKNEYYVFEGRLKHKKGHWVWILDKGKVFQWSEDGKPLLMFGTHQDISEQKNYDAKVNKQNEELLAVEEELRQNLEELHTSQEDLLKGQKALIAALAEKKAITDALNRSSIVAISDANGNMRNVNKNFINASGYSEKELIGKNHQMVNSGYHSQDFWAEMWAKINSGEIWRGEICNQAKNGEIYWVDTVINPILDDLGNIKSFLSIQSLITARKKTENELKKSEAKFRTLFETLSVGITITDEKGQILNSNKAAEQILGLSAEKQKQREIDSIEWKIIRTDGSLMPAEEYASVRAMKEQKLIDNVEMGVFRGKNDIAWIIVSAAPITDVGIVIAYQEISDLKRAEWQTQKSNEKLQSILNEIQEVVWSVNLPDYKTIFASPSVEKLYENSIEEWHKNSNLWAEFIHPDDKHHIKTIYDTLHETGRSYIEYRIVTKSGIIKWVSNKSKIIFDDNHQPMRIDGIISDISEKVKQKAALEDAKNQAITIGNYYKDLVENQTIYIIKTDMEGKYIFLNEHYRNDFGRNERIGTYSLSNIFKEDWAKTAETVEKCIENPEIGFYVVLRKHQIDGKLVHNYWEFKAIKNAEGIISEILCIGFDITQMHVIQEELKATLIRVEKQNERLQNFAHIVSHNLRSHAGNISSLIEFLPEDSPNLRQNEYYNYLIEASNNLTEAINHLSLVAQLHTNEPSKLTPINLDEVVKKAISNIIALAKNVGLTINHSLKGNEMVMGEVTYLDSIVLNFLTNAIKYRAQNRENHVNISCFEEGKFIVLQIEDNGIGIDLERNGRKLFGMFKTFHNNADARGVGLFITKNQVEALGGKIEVESELNVGTRFKIYLQNGNI